MRVISQDGTIDTPYELSMIWIREKYGYTVMANMPNDEPAGLGKYSSREKALKSMKMLREAWINENVEFEDGIYHRNIIFQFPQDDEIEV